MPLCMTSQTTVTTVSNRETQNDTQQFPRHHNTSTMVTANNFLILGLTMQGMSHDEINGKSEKRQLELFSAHFGASPDICVLLWHESTPHDPSGGKMRPVHLLWALYFLRCYPTEEQLEATVHRSPKTVRKWIWLALNRIQSLLPTKVSVKRCCCVVSIYHVHSRVICLFRP